MIDLNSLEAVSTSTRGGSGSILAQQSSGRYRLYLNQTAISLLSEDMQKFYAGNKKALNKKHLFCKVLKNKDGLYLAISKAPSWGGKSLQYLSSTLYLNVDKSAADALLQALLAKGLKDFRGFERVDCSDASISLLQLKM